MGVYTMRGKPRWACALCGMYSSRKCSVKRHIENLHDGLGNIVSFIDYIAGRRQGVYFPNPFLTAWLSRPFNLVFTVFEVASVLLAATILNLIAHDGKSNWFEGVMLTAVYVIIAIGFFFIP